MKKAPGFYHMGCNKFKVNGEPNMTDLKNKSTFGEAGFDFRKMNSEEVDRYFLNFLK
jgi:hypothetical protein